MEDILFVNSKNRVCGINQYGLSSAMILSKSSKYRVTYTEIDTLKSLEGLDDKFKAFIFNYHPATLGCLNAEENKFKNKQLVIVGHDHFFNKRADVLISCDCTQQESENFYTIGRPILNYNLNVGFLNPEPEEIIIGTFGFPFAGKNFDKLIDIAADSFSKFKLRMHFARYPQGDQFNSILDEVNRKIGQYQDHQITTEITTNFLSIPDLTNWLNLNTINVFLYPDYSMYRGLSSAIDFAISANRPIAISDSQMFRHINSEERFLLSKYKLKEILNFGIKPLKQFKQKWSEENFVSKYEQILDNL